MGVLDKIKNALFEVEYVEVEEPPKKERKEKKKDKKEDKPIAKKIVLPGKREEKVEEIQEEELKDEDFEIRPKDEVIKAKEEFQFIDDNDFKEDYYPEEPEIVEVYDQNDVGKRNDLPVIDDYFEEKRVEEVYSTPKQTREERSRDIYDNYYQPEKPLYSTPRESKPYGVDNSYSIPMHQYGTYEKKEEKTYFKPSPIISPIYGVLDKNYKKEDVKEKKEVRITSSYTRTNVSVDDIRDKAYGEKQSLEKENDEVNDISFDVEEDDNLLVDLSDRGKPEVKQLTVGDAEEYFQDLGLEYNVDYVDVSTDKDKIKKEVPKHVKKEEVIELADKEELVVQKTSVDKKDELEKKKSVDDDNDNLFDLIDSMYQENE